MKSILKLTSIILLLMMLLLVVGGYIVLADSEQEKEYVENYIYEDVIQMSTEEENSSSVDSKKTNETIKDNIIVKDEKYLKEYKTSNGEQYTIIGSLKIPKINVEYDILSDTSVALLKVSLNRYWGAQPNEVGNMCVVGHNYLDSRFFGKLHTLREGDFIEVTDSYNRTEKYYVYDMFVADPYDTRCTSQLTNGEKEITLITCYNKGTQRLVVKARAEKDKTVETTINLVNKILESIK